MVTKKTIKDEKFTDVDFPLFPALEALDKKDYGFFDRLTTEQQKSFVPFMLLQWMATISGRSDLQRYYLQNANYVANKHLFNENIIKHNKLQWLMLCSISPDMGKQFHKWVPHIKRSYSLLTEQAKTKDLVEYFSKVYPNTDENLLKEVSEEYARVQKRKYYFAQQFPNLKVDDIEALNQIVTDEEIEQYEKDKGN